MGKTVWEEARVLVTVKASPEPSAKYDDTVCVAGIRLDGAAPTWVRLYPIRFRWLDKVQQFAKYDLIDIPITRAPDDDRLESHRPNLERAGKAGSLRAWLERERVMRDVPRTTTCALRQGATTSLKAPSLGMVEPADISGLEFHHHGGWTASQEAKIARSLSVQTEVLFGPDVRVPPPLIAPRFKVEYRYRCAEAACPGHQGQILDWELSELQRRYQGDAEIKAAVRANFLDRMWNSGRATSFFLGNFANPAKRQSFSVLGVYYPPRSDVLKAAMEANHLF